MLQKKKLLICLLSMLIIFSIIGVIILVKPDDYRQNLPDKEIETPSDTDGTIDITIDNFIVPEEIIISIDENNVNIPYSLPDNSITPSFSILSGNSVMLSSNNKIDAVNFGITEIKAKADDIVKTIKVIVFNLTITCDNNLKYGKDANGVYSTYYIDLQANYRIESYEITNTNLQNINRINSNLDKTSYRFSFEILNSIASFNIKVYDLEFSLDLTATPFIDKFDYNLSNNLQANPQNEYELYTISSEEYIENALQDGYPTFTKIEILNTNEYIMECTNENIKIDNNIITAISEGKSSIRITATDHSNYSEEIKFNIISTSLRDVICDVDEITLSITKDKERQINYSFKPLYATNLSYEIVYNNEIILLDNNVVTAKNVGKTSIDFYINSVLKKQIFITILEEYNVMIYNNLTGDAIDITSFTHNFAHSNDLSFRYEIRDHKGQLSINQSLNIVIIENANLLQSYDFNDKIYLNINSTGKIIIKLENENLRILEYLNINIT